jgi:Flp pilus assembly protein TadD
VRARLATAAGALALAALVALGYAGALSCGWIWDDDFHVTANATLRSADGLRRIWLELGATPQYYPLVHTSFWLEYRIFGLEPAGYHANNALLHAASAVLGWRALLRLGFAPAAAWLAAAIFAVHPVQVESVAWVTERKNVLSGALYLASLLAYLRYLGFGASGGVGRPRDWALSFALYAGALASKTVTCTLAPALLLLVYCRRGRLSARDLRALAPFVVLGLGAGLLTVAMEKSTVGAVGSEWELSLVERVLVAGRAFWFYLGKLAWPAELAFIYPRWSVDSGAVWQYLYPVSAVALVISAWAARGRIGKAPFTGLAFFAGTLFPALGFFDVYPMRFSFVADHFQYLASFGPIALAALAACSLAGRLGRSGRLAGAALAAALLAVLVGLTRQQVQIYRDAETLWAETIRVNPGAWIAWNNLGQIVSARGDAQRGIELYRRAIEVAPRFEMAHYNLGSALADAGNLDEAIPHLELAIELAPRHLDSYNNLGKALARAGRRDEAIASWRAGLAVDDRHAKLQLNLGIALRQRGELAAATDALRRCVELRPDWARAHRELAAALREQGLEAEARTHLERADELRKLRRALSATPARGGRRGSGGRRSAGGAPPG